MSSVIEVLEDLIDKFSTWRTPPEYLSKKELNALGEAIVALEQKEKLSKFVEEKNKDLEFKKKIHFDKCKRVNCNICTSIEFSEIFLKEFLELV